MRPALQGEGIMIQDTTRSREIITARLGEIKDEKLKVLTTFLLHNSSDMAKCAAEVFFYIIDKSWENVWKDKQTASDQLTNLWLAVFGELPSSLVENSFRDL